MSRAERIPAAVWDIQKDRIRSLYLDQDKTLDEVRQLMAEKYDFHASKPQYIRRVTVVWKMRKNSTKEEWAQAGALVSKRKAEGKLSELMMVEKVVPEKKLKRELKRYAGQAQTISTTPEGVSQDIAVYTPPTDMSQDIFIFTPPSSGPKVAILNTLPLFRLRDKLNALFAPIPMRHNSSLDMVAVTSLTKSLPPTTSLVPNDLSKALLEASCETRHSGNESLSVSQMMSLINEAIPKGPGVLQHQPLALSQPWISFFHHAIYLSTNGLLPGTGMDKLLQLTIEIGAIGALKEVVLIDSPESKTFASNLLFSVIRVQKDSGMDFFRFLLRRGVNPDSVDSDPGADKRRTALQTAVREKNIRAVQLLLEFGADPNALCKGTQGEKRSPLNLALWGPQRSSIAEVLINARANLTATVFTKDGEPQSAIMLAAENRDIDRIKQLLRTGADPNHLALHGLSALHIAIGNRDREIVETLLNGGADPNLLCESKHVERITEAAERLRETKERLSETLGQLVWELQMLKSSRLRSPINAAVSAGSLPIIRCLLKAGADPDGYVNPGFCASQKHLKYDLSTALQCAIRRGDYYLAESLLGKGAGANVRYTSLSSPLQLACGFWDRRPGKRRLVELLLQRGADVNAAPCRNEGATALQAAVQSGDFDLAELLLESHDADVNAPAASDGGRTALQAAAETGNMKLINLLVSHGAVLAAEAAETYGMTCIQAAASSGNMDLLDMMLQLFGSQAEEWEMAAALQAAVKSGSTTRVQKLLDIGADVNTKENEYPLLCEAIWQNDSNMLDFLLSKGGDPNPLSPDPTPLWVAVHEGHRSLAQRLIEAGADVDHASVHSCRNLYDCYPSRLEDIDPHLEKEEPILAAVATERADLVQLLLDAGADTNVCAATLLVNIADNYGHATIGQLLLRHGTNPDERLFDGTTALHQVILRQNHGMLRILVDYKAGVNVPSKQEHPIQLLIKTPSWNCEDLQILLNAGADVNVSAVEGFPMTPLQAAIAEDKKAMVELLLESGADIYVPAFWKAGLTALQAAAKTGDIELVQDLISRGADIHAPPARVGGATALQQAAMGGRIDIVRLLLEAGARVNDLPASEGGATALQYAAMNGHLNIAILLLEEGAHINAPAAPVAGRTALQGAAEHGRLDIVHLLLENDEEPGSLEERCKDAAGFAEREDYPFVAEVLRNFKTL